MLNYVLLSKFFIEWEREKKWFDVEVFLMIREQEENKKAHLKIHHNLWERNLVQQAKHLDKRKVPYLVPLLARLIKANNG